MHTSSADRPRANPEIRQIWGWIWLTCISIAFALLLVGCSNNPYPNELSASKTLFLVGDDPVNLDPVYCYNIGDGPIVNLIYPCYYHYKFLRRNPYSVELELGASEPVRTSVPLTVKDAKGIQKSVVGERWTFHIRHGVRFSDDPCFVGGKGREVIAKDIVYSFKRMADPKNECPVASYFADKVVGWPEYSDGFPKSKALSANRPQYDKEMAGVQADPKDPYAFSITLNQPYPQLRYLMAMTFTTPQAREAVEKYGDEYKLHHLVGCGPFMLKEYRPHESIYLVRNPNAFRTVYPSEADPQFVSMLGDAGKDLPLVDGIYLPVIKEAVTGYNLFQQGYLDALGVSSANAQVVPASNGLTQEMKDRGITLRKNFELNFDYLAFNMKDPVVGGYTPEKKKLRQAISLAIDSDALISLVSQGMGLSANWMIPPGLLGYDPAYKNPYRQFDPKLTKAKQLLSEAGYPNGVDSKGDRLVIKFDNSATTPIARATINLYKQQIERLNIEVDLISTSYNKFQEKVVKGQAQFFNYGWYADYPDPENFLFLLYGPNAPPGPNGSIYDNPEYNRLFEQMRSMPDSPARLKIENKMRDIAVEDCPVICVSHSETRTLLQPWTSNRFSHPMAYDTLKYVSVNADLRQKLQSAWNHPNLVPLGVFLILVIAAIIPASATFKRRMNRKVRSVGTEELGS